MKNMSVKEYAKLIGKNEKTVYKMIKDETVVTLKENGKFRIKVDKNLLKIIERAQQALNEAKAILLTIEKASDQIVKPVKIVSQVAKTVAKRSEPKKQAVKKSTKTAAKPIKKMVKKVSAKNPVAKKSPKK
ncbi:MAG: hypothetical protein PF439_10200 [Helicobacteraceae bacterium]|jgi:hypothetical protein|nr:hypothetical protein [Helicobacteraceae bacterium]